MGIAADIPREAIPQLRFFLGDVRDRSRLTRALEGDTVVRGLHSKCPLLSTTRWVH